MRPLRALPSTMFLHIMRKDWKLLWPLGVACAVLQGVLALLEYRPESFAASGGENAAAMILSLSIGIGLALTILLVVQQDAIPGVDQDWLVRPIERRDLLVAKVLLLILVVHGPIVAVHWLRGVAEGLAPYDMLRATLLSNLELALSFSLPVLTLAVLARTVTEALVTALAALFFVLLSNLLIATMVMTVTHSFHLGGPTDDTGIDWILGLLHHAVLVCTAVAVVGLQYYRRDTRTSRIVLGVGLLLFVIVGRLPWQPAFALQEALSAEPQAGQAVTIGFAPAPAPAPASGAASGPALAPASASASVAASASGAASPTSVFALQESDVKARQKPAPPGQQRLRVGIEVWGLPPGSVLHADRVAFRLVDAAGGTVYRGTGQDWDLRAAGDGTASVRQVIDLPKNVYARSLGRRVDINIDYSLTLLKSRVLPALPASAGNELLAEVGRCVSRVDDDGAGFQVGCDAAGPLPPCLSVSLRRDTPEQRGPETLSREAPGQLGPETLSREAPGQRSPETLGRDAPEQLGPETFVCDLDYEPAAWRFSVEPIERFVRKLSLEDLDRRSPTASSDAAAQGAAVVFRLYVAVAHFSRRVVVPEVRARDFAAGPPSP